MASSLLILLGATVSYLLYTFVSGLSKNIAEAKRSGLPYIIVPASPYNIPWQLTHKLWIAIFKMLFPKSWGQDHIRVLSANWEYEYLFDTFNRLGDNFIVVSPGHCLMYTANADMIRSVTSKREAFPKETETYKILALYGENVLVTEGALWRRHRKVTSASFNEPNAALVFKESIKQAQGLTNYWLGADGKGDKTIKSVERDTMTLTLNIISYVGFGIPLLWPNQSLPADLDPNLAKWSSHEAPEGHSLTFKDSLANTMEYLLALLITPRWLLKILPFEWAKKAYEAEVNYTRYMDEFLQAKIEATRRGEHDEGMDIMGQLVRTSHGEKQKDGQTELSDSEIIGNAFIMIVAGHETTANTTHFTLVELANNPEAQRRLQADIDKIFGGKEPATWDYEEKINAMLASMLGACMNETLRTMPPVVVMPKMVSSKQDQAVNIEGKNHVLARGLSIALVSVGAHHNPKYWPCKPSKITNSPSDLEDYVPERWFRTQSDQASSDAVEGADTEDFGGFKGSDVSSQLFHPVRGSYVPFNDGARSCLGRRIAQVEMVAILATIFQKYSVELAVDDWASDEQVDKMGKEQRKKVYRQAQDKSRATVRAAESRITLKLHGEKYVPIRLVPRGQERFVSWAMNG